MPLCSISGRSHCDLQRTCGKMTYTKICLDQKQWCWAQGFMWTYHAPWLNVPLVFFFWSKRIFYFVIIWALQRSRPLSLRLLCWKAWLADTHHLKYSSLSVFAWQFGSGELTAGKPQLEEQVNAWRKSSSFDYSAGRRNTINITR